MCFQAVVSGAWNCVMGVKRSDAGRGAMSKEDGISVFAGVMLLND
jgi:hypothetical protein